MKYDKLSKFSSISVYKLLTSNDFKLPKQVQKDSLLVCGSGVDLLERTLVPLLPFGRVDIC